MSDLQQRIEALYRSDVRGSVLLIVCLWATILFVLLMTWGYMVGAGRTRMLDAWWISFFPGIAIFLTVLALNLVGEGLNDALNPRLARRRQ